MLGYCFVLLGELLTALELKDLVKDFVNNM